MINKWNHLILNNVLKWVVLMVKLISNITKKKLHPMHKIVFWIIWGKPKNVEALNVFSITLEMRRFGKQITKERQKTHTSHYNKTAAKHTDKLNIHKPYPQCSLALEQRSSEFQAVKIFKKLSLSIKQRNSMICYINFR